MLDAAFVRANLDAVKANCYNRNVKAEAAAALAAAADRAVQLDDERRRLVQEKQILEQRANELAKSVGKAIQAEKDEARKRAIKEQIGAEGKALREQIAALEERQKQAEADRDAALLLLPNMTHPDAPVGHTEADNKTIRTWGQPRQFDFTPRDHVALCEALQLADFEAGTTVAGQKFYFLTNEGALLEMALVQYAMQALVREGFTPVITPDVARFEVLEGIGFQPRDPDPEKRQVYTLADTDLCLVATAEITLGGMHRGKIFDEKALPLRYGGLSHCFRMEAGAAGRDTRGLYRVHQFTKVEMFAFCTPEQSEQIHLDLLRIEEGIFQGLGLPYRVIDTCTGDLGGPAYRKYDLEAWMPGRGEKGEYGEVTSTSNCTDFQARRLDVRYRPAGQKGSRFVHTLNGTAVACTRALLAVLENYQQADGSVVVPEALRPLVGKDRIGPR
jgi:seryl-tRNA synthetase